MDPHALDNESAGVNIVCRNYYNKRRSLASGFDFVPENPNQICKKLRSLIQEKEGGNDSQKIEEELVVIIKKSLV